MANQLIEEIKTSIAQSKTKEEIYLGLLQQGYRVDDITIAYGLAGLVEDRDETQKRTIRIMVVIGALLIGAGIFSFVAANWQEMRKTMKVAVIVASMLAAYGAGWHLKENKGLGKTGNALILLGSIIYGSGIFLIGQMFHTRNDWPDAFILWMFGMLALGWALEASWLFIAAVPLGLLALIGHPIDLFSEIKIDSFVLTSIFLLLAATGATFWTAVSFQKKVSRESK